MERQRCGLAVISLAVLLVMLAGCGQSSTMPVPAGPDVSGPAAGGGMASLLPPLPAPGSSRQGMSAVPGAIAGLNEEALGGSTEIRNSQRLVRSATGDVSWAMYQVNVGQGSLLSFTPLIRTFHGPAFIAVSDYGLGRWRFLGSTTGSDTFAVPAEVQGDDHHRLYLLYVAWDGSSLAVQRTLIVREDPDRGPESISGRVVDGAGQPVAGLVFTATGGDFAPEAYSDEDGRFTLAVGAAGTFLVRPDVVNTQGYQPQSTPVTVAADEQVTGLEFVYVANELRGRVATANGQVFDDVELRLYQGPGLENVDTTNTWPDGTYEFTSIPDGAARLFAKIPTYSFTPQATDLAFVGAPQQLDLLAQPNAPTLSISGRVTNPYANGAGMEGIEVHIDHSDVMALTDADGYYTLSGLAPDPFQPYIVGSGAPSGSWHVWGNNREILLDSASVAGIDFQLTPQARLIGSVVNADDEPIKNVQVSVDGRAPVFTNSNGDFYFDELSPGTYTLYVSDPQGIYSFGGATSVVMAENDVRVTIRSL